MNLSRFLFGAIILFAAASCGEKKIDFSAEVKPILNKRCISCHGGVKRNAKFSLLFRHDALDTTESGKPAIIPGDAKHSEMIRRLTLKDPEERMPYKEEPLTEEEIDILTRWIDQGAEWGDHWAYVPPKPVEVPKPGTLLGSVGTDEFVKNEIDYFILNKLEDANLTPSPRADKATLMRRVYMDVIGLPPTEAQAKKFLEDNRPEAYEQLVDELLASPQYGEKWASWWLDLARYSDTKGYEKDGPRVIWRYRDWVINALNADKPFDQFTIEQLAGDLLPAPTDDQLLATAFHRNTMNNDEGGTDDEEFRVASILDRVNTTWEVWQSTTMACVQCHTHPYDPFVHEDYYKSFAFFNNTRDEDTDGEEPNLRSYKPEDEAKVLEIKKWVAGLEGEQRATEVTRFLKTLEPKIHPHDFDQFVNGELIDTKYLGIRHKGSARLKNVDLSGKEYLFTPYRTRTPGGSMEIRLDKPDGTLLGKATFTKNDGWNRTMLRVPIKPTEGRHDLYFVFFNPTIQPNWAVVDLEWFAFTKGLPKDGSKAKEMDQEFMRLLTAQADNTPVMVENGPDQSRETRVFERGNWMAKTALVKPGVPASLNVFRDDFPANRLGFAKWLVAPENPLTSRTIVNRVWEQIFGYGIVETLEDFGTQAATPFHPELLDWLSLRLINEHHWSLKKLTKDILLSGTYQQQSKVTPQLLELDPANRYLARGPRVRLSGEQVRDQALAASNLLSLKMHGPPVMPFQPEGVWASVYSGERWVQSKNEDFYRRSVYTYAKRTSPYPAFVTFDGSSREVCVSRRIRTNTPLQALVTMNDSTYVVAARSFADMIMKKESAPEKQIKAGYKMLLYKELSENKLNVLKGLYAEALKTYQAKPEEAKKLLAKEQAAPEAAAMTVVAQAILNLDEVITKE